MLTILTISVFAGRHEKLSPCLLLTPGCSVCSLLFLFPPPALLVCPQCFHFLQLFLLLWFCMQPRLAFELIILLLQPSTSTGILGVCYMLVFYFVLSSLWGDLREALCVLSKCSTNRAACIPWRVLDCPRGRPLLVNEGVLSLHSFLGVFCTSIYLLSIHLLTLGCFQQLMISPAYTYDKPQSMLVSYGFPFW